MGGRRQRGSEGRLSLGLQLNVDESTLDGIQGVKSRLQVDAKQGGKIRAF